MRGDLFLDKPPSAPDALVVLAWAVGLLAAYLVFAYAPWGRLVEAGMKVEIPLPSFRRVRDALRRLRAAVDPAGEGRRALGAYLAALPPRSGLSLYDEYLAEARELPEGRERAAIIRSIRRNVRVSPAARLRAADNAGRPAVSPRIVKVLLAGKEPAAFKRVRKLTEERKERV